ncbi:MAG: hypothetical protein RR588_12820 [Solibacillus sp.]
MSLILNICYLIYSQYEGEEIRVSIHNRILYPSLRDMLTKSGEALIGSILRAVHHLFELQDKQSAVGYIYKIVKNSTKEDMGKIIEQLESNELKGRVFVITLE